jgi:hypothetical protein
VSICLWPGYAPGHVYMEGPIEIRVTDVPIVWSNARVKGTNSLVFSQFWNWTPFT